MKYILEQSLKSRDCLVDMPKGAEILGVYRPVSSIGAFPKICYLCESSKKNAKRHIKTFGIGEDGVVGTYVGMYGDFFKGNPCFPLNWYVFDLGEV